MFRRVYIYHADSRVRARLGLFLASHLFHPEAVGPPEAPEPLPGPLEPQALPAGTGDGLGCGSGGPPMVLVVLKVVLVRRGSF